MRNIARRVILVPLSASIVVSVYSAWTMPVVEPQYFKLIVACVLAIGLVVYCGRTLLWLSILLAIAWQPIALDHSMWTLGSAMVSLMLWSNAISILDRAQADQAKTGEGACKTSRLGLMVSMLSFGCLTSYSAFLHIEDPIWRSGEIGRTLLTANYLSRFPNLFFEIFDWPFMSALSALTSWIIMLAFMTAPILALLAYRYLFFYYLWITVFGAFIVSSLAFLRLGRLPWVELSVLGFWVCEGRERFHLPARVRFGLKGAHALLPVTPVSKSEMTLEKQHGVGGENSLESRLGIRFVLVAISFLSGSSLLLSSNYSAVGIPEPQSLARMLPGMAWRGGRPVYFSGIGPINVFNTEDLNMDLRWRTFEVIENDKRIDIPINEPNGERGDWLFHDTLYFGNDLQWRREASISPEECLTWLDSNHRLNRPITALISKKYPTTIETQVQISAWSRPELGSRERTLECRLVVPLSGN